MIGFNNHAPCRFTAAFMKGLEFMCRLFGFRSILQSHVHQSLVSAENALLQQSDQHPDGWGLAYYLADVPHLIKSVQTAQRDSLYRQISELVSSETVLAHIRKATVGSLSVINTHPFQYGPWVFAHNGKIAHFGQTKALIRERIDPALRRCIMGETDSEHFFYLILTHLSRRAELQKRDMALDTIAIAARAAVADICSITGGFGPGDSLCPSTTFLTFILTNGKSMLALQGGKELHYSTFKKSCSRRHECPRFLPSCENPSSDGLVNHLILASEPLLGENHWMSLEFGQWIGVDRNMRLQSFPKF